MVLTVISLLVLSAVVMTLVHAAWGKLPLWIPVLLLGLVHLVALVPLGR
jgi:hypothetical protein